MAEIEKTITINASVEKVFGYVDEPANRPEFWPSLVEVSDVQRLPNGGSRIRWVYKMAGVRFEGTGEDIEHVPNQRIVNRNKSPGLEATIAWSFEPEGDGTKVTFEADYTVPIPLLNKLAESFIIKMNEHEAEVLLANLKARMEA